jgi:hypothetical protein
MPSNEPAPRTYAEEGKKVLLSGFALGSGTLLSLFLGAALIGHSYNVAAIVGLIFLLIPAVVVLGARSPSIVTLTDKGIEARGILGNVHFIRWAEIRSADQSTNYVNMRRYRVIKLSNESGETVVRFGDTIAGYDEVVAEIRRRLPTLRFEGDM